MKYSHLIHPLIYSLLAVLSLYVQNINKATLGMIQRPLLFSILGCFILLAALGMILKNGKKAAIITSLFFITNLGYRPTLMLVTLSGFRSLFIYLFIPFTIFFLFMSYVIIRRGNNLTAFSRALNGGAILLLGIVLFQIAPHEIVKVRQTAALKKLRAGETSYLPAQSTLPAASPDIYYLIFDRYAHFDTLKSEFNLDNSAFYQSLKNMGFYIVNEARANYPKTFLSLASSLNMQHLKDLESLLNPSENYRDETIVYEMLEDYPVWRMLKNRGYHFIHLGDWWPPTKMNKYADLNLSCANYRLDDFTSIYVMTSFFFPYLEILSGGKVERLLAKSRTSLQEAIPCQFNQIAAVAGRPGPKFIFAHFFVPHEPYLFGPDGEKLSAEEINSRSIKENYANQLLFTNKRITALVDHILRHSAQPPVIVLQSDEGPCDPIPGFKGECGEGIDWRQLPTRALKAHMKIFNALFLPDIDPSPLYPSLTPVNTFRIIFNTYFGTRYELLEDKSYAIPDVKHPYDFTDITHILSDAQ